MLGHTEGDALFEISMHNLKKRIGAEHVEMSDRTSGHDNVKAALATLKQKDAGFAN
jgi:hypothetical protein